jgi:hypothetical protein
VEGQDLKEVGATSAGQQWHPSKEELASWAGKLWKCNYIHQFSFKLNIDKNE